MGTHDMTISKGDINKLTLFAYGQLRNKYFAGERNGHPPGGTEAKDFVQLAVEKTLSGERKWNPDKCSFLDHLAGAIRSEIWNASVLQENKETEREFAKNSITTEQQDSKIVRLLDYRDPERIETAREELNHILTFLQRRDSRLREFADHIILEGLSGSIELSQAMGITVAAVNNLKKRLRRALLDYRKREEGI